MKTCEGEQEKERRDPQENNQMGGRKWKGEGSWTRRGPLISPQGEFLTVVGSGAR